MRPAVRHDRGDGIRIMPNTFTTTGARPIPATVERAEQRRRLLGYFVRCQDLAGNPGTQTDFAISFSVALPADTTAPVRSSGSPPSEDADRGAAQTTLSLTTNESATCQYATTAGTAYASIPEPLHHDYRGATAHSTSVSGLTTAAGPPGYFVRCQDVAGQRQPNDFTIRFSVALSGTGGLVVAYSFNEGTGTSAADASGNGHTGAISGAAWSTLGEYGNALSFDGVNDWVTVNATSLLNITGAITMEAWVFPTATSGVRDILIKEGSNGDIYNLYAHNGNGRPESNVLVGGWNSLGPGRAALPSTSGPTWRGPTTAPPCGCSSTVCRSRVSP